MESSTDSYKDTSFAYNKDFTAYNIAARNLPCTEEPLPIEKPQHRRKRGRGQKLPVDKEAMFVFDDGPMSHQDYIRRRRIESEAGSSQLFERLGSDVLGSANSVQLVEYKSDESTAECEVFSPMNSGLQNDVYQVKSRTEQRFAVPGEPVCVICGKYGEYICNETDDDICSMDCKVELLKNIQCSEGLLSKHTLIDHTTGPFSTSQELDFREDALKLDRHWLSINPSSLCAYKCWKCQRPGHLADDCLVMMTSTSQLSSIFQTREQAKMGESKYKSIPRGLRELYRRCHQLGKNLAITKCNMCNGLLNLATCLDCNLVFCDSSGHLNEHIMDKSSHRQFYSHKLKRLVKCCKSTCKVTDIRDLLACPNCFDNAFDKFYDKFSATWKGGGLSMISGSICCEDHFSWHRMNCLNANVEDSAYVVRRMHFHKSNPSLRLSNFIF